MSSTKRLAEALTTIHLHDRITELEAQLDEKESVERVLAKIHQLTVDVEEQDSFIDRHIAREHNDLIITIQKLTAPFLKTVKTN